MGTSIKEKECVILCESVRITYRVISYFVVLVAKSIMWSCKAVIPTDSFMIIKKESRLGTVLNTVRAEKFIIPLYSCSKSCINE